MDKNGIIVEIDMRYTEDKMPVVEVIIKTHIQAVQRLTKEKHAVNPVIQARFDC